MPLIEEFLNSPNHCQTTAFTFELRMCDKQGCKICARIKRKIRTPDVEVDKYNLLEGVLCWQDLPLLKSFHNDHYLSSTDAQVHIDEATLYTHTYLLMAW